jgi:hypothetical protein
VQVNVVALGDFPVNVACAGDFIRTLVAFPHESRDRLPLELGVLRYVGNAQLSGAAVLLDPTDAVSEAAHPRETARQLSLPQGEHA